MKFNIQKSISIRSIKINYCQFEKYFFFRFFAFFYFTIEYKFLVGNAKKLQSFSELTFHSGLFLWTVENKSTDNDNMDSNFPGWFCLLI